MQIVRGILFPFLFILATTLLSPVAHGEEKDKLQLAALHPILGDLAKRIGGPYVEVTDLLKPNGNLHAFEPRSEDILNAGKADILFASGKLIEPYLNRLKDGLPGKTEIVNVGESIPDVTVSDENACAACCEGHDHDHDHVHTAKVDPHWWHSMDNIKKAALVMEQALSRKDPLHSREYAKNREDISKECDRLKGWARRQILTIPSEKRILVTGHAAFGHLCHELGFRQIAIQGSAREDEGRTRHMAESLKRIREVHAQAVFPEFQSSPKVLEEIAKTLSIKTGNPLVSDGTAPHAHTFDSMYEYNITAIVDALSPNKNTNSEQ